MLDYSGHAKVARAVCKWEEERWGDEDEPLGLVVVVSQELYDKLQQEMNIPPWADAQLEKLPEEILAARKLMLDEFDSGFWFTIDIDLPPDEIRVVELRGPISTILFRDEDAEEKSSVTRTTSAISDATL